LPVHRINLLEILEIKETGAAIFAINQVKYDVHRTNSVVDYATRIAVLCFTPISSGMNSISPGQKLVSGVFREMAGNDRTRRNGNNSATLHPTFSQITEESEPARRSAFHMHASNLDR